MTDTGLFELLRSALEASGPKISGAELKRFGRLIDHSKSKRKTRQRRWSKARLASAKEDILRLILDASGSGNRDEALWLAFIAAHFGRESADAAVDGQVESSYRFICAFGLEPRWTWKQVKRDSQSLQRWLIEHRRELHNLSFGNHRKFESQKPDRLWEVLDSFIGLVEDNGGTPTTLFDTDPSVTRTARYAELYERLRPLLRFGRTGRLDFLMLLNDLGLVEAEPDSCHIVGSTGPLEGARRLWGRNKTPRELGVLADQLAETLGCSPIVVEDALCLWQKD